MEEGNCSEGRIDPGTSAATAVSFKAYWIADFYGGDCSLSADFRADIIDTSDNGMLIKTSFPLAKGDVLETVKQYNTSEKEIAMVRRVDRVNNNFYVGLLYMPEPVQCRV